MSEREPQINLAIGSQEFQLRRENSELFRYFGALAIWDHLFVVDNEDDEVRRGTFIPRELIGHEPFDMVAQAMLEADYPARLGQRAVLDSDAEIITRSLAGKDIQNLDEERPDWLPE